MGIRALFSTLIVSPIAFNSSFRCFTWRPSGPCHCFQRALRPSHTLTSQADAFLLQPKSSTPCYNYIIIQFLEVQT